MLVLTSTATAMPLRTDAFDKTSGQAAPYWIGMLMADGCVNRNGTGWTIGLGLKDRDHVERFRDFLGATNKIEHYQGPLGEWWRVRVTNTRLAEALAVHGVLPRKSATAQAGDAVRYNPHFWRGVVDGDGTVARRQDGYYRLRLVGSRPLLQQFDAFASIVTRQPSQVRPKAGSTALYEWGKTGRDAERVIRFLYEGAAVALPRKWDMAREVINRNHNF